MTRSSCASRRSTRCRPCWCWRPHMRSPGRWSPSAAAVTVRSAARALSTLWAATAALLIGARGSARMLAQLSAPAERTLIVGGSKARAMLAHSLMADPGAHVEVVGFLPLEDERRSHSDWGSRLAPQARRLARRTWSRSCAELRVDRVFLIPTSADSETMLAAVRRASAIGVKLSIVPRLFEVVGLGGRVRRGRRRDRAGRASPGPGSLLAGRETDDGFDRRDDRAAAAGAARRS